MAIEKNSGFSLEVISEQLGVSSEELKTFLTGKLSAPPSSQPSKFTAIFVIDEFIKNLNELVQINKRSVETWKTYNNFLIRCKSYLNETSPDLLITEINEIILNKIILYNDKEKKYATKTINKYNAIFKSIMTFAFKMNYTQKDLGYKFNITGESLIPKYIRDDDVLKIIKVTELLPKSYRCRAIIIFLLGTGCRVGEVSKIKVKDFDIENELIYIKGKRNKERMVPMFKEVKDEILAYLKLSGMEEWDSKCDGYLFARDEGTERSRNFPIRTIEYLIERIKYKLPEHLNYITVHTFRHTFAVKCLKIGIDLHNLCLILGHDNPKTTMIYTQLYNEDLKELINNKFSFPFENLLKEVITSEDIIQ